MKSLKKLIFFVLAFGLFFFFDANGLCLRIRYRI